MTAHRGAYKDISLLGSYGRSCRLEDGIHSTADGAHIIFHVGHARARIILVTSPHCSADVI